MTNYEILTLVVSLVAVVIALTSLVRTRKLSERYLELQEKTAQLAERQLRELEQAEREKALPRLRVELGKLGKSYCFLIINRGSGSAFDLTFELVDCADPPVSRGEIEEKFPYPELKPESRVKLLAAIHMGSPRVFQVRLEWKDYEDQGYTEDFTVSL